MPLRYARWCAVSSKEQAASDKFSIPVQLEKTKAAAEAKGWLEACPPFIVPGQSRTKYLTLEAAARAIPALAAMLDAARNSRFDVLVMTEHDRLRELLDPVFNYLAKYSIQLVSLAQWIEPVPREQYDRYASDAVAMSIGLSTIISRADISRLRRKWREQMPLRVTQRGLPMHMSWGYRKPAGQEDSRKAIPEQNPEICRHILHMKDMLLSGASTPQIVQYLESHNVPPPRAARWYSQTARDILRNPFYAGWVSFGISRVYLDPNGQRRRNRQIPESETYRARGKHVPLWNDDTRQALIAELHRRSTHYRGRMNNQFTGLIKCGCGASMWRHENGPRADRLIWRCSVDKKHLPITHSNLLQLVGIELVKELRIHRDEQAAPDPEAGQSPEAARAELNAQLERLETAYLEGQMSLDRYALHKGRLSARVADLDAEQAMAAQRTAARESFAEAMRELSAEDVTDWLGDKKPERQLNVNRRLHLMLQKIVVHGGKVVEVKFAA